MSVVRLCDCKCHEYDEYNGRIDEFEQWAVFDGKDVCQWCLEGRGCRYWFPRVYGKEATFGEMIATINAVYSNAIFNQLRSGPLFKGLASDGK